MLYLSPIQRSRAVYGVQQNLIMHLQTIKAVVYGKDVKMLSMRQHPFLCQTVMTNHHRLDVAGEINSVDHPCDLQYSTF